MFANRLRWPLLHLLEPKALMTYLFTGMITTAYFNYGFGCFVNVSSLMLVSVVSFGYYVFRTSLIWSNIPCCYCAVVWNIWTSTSMLDQSLFVVLFHSWMCTDLHQLVVVGTFVFAFELFVLIRPVRIWIKNIVRIFSRLYFFTNLTCVVIIEVIKILLSLQRVLIYNQNFITYRSSRYVLLVWTFTLSFNLNILTICVQNYLSKHLFSSLFILINLNFVRSWIGNSFLGMLR